MLHVFFNTLILQFYRKSQIWCAWLFNQRANSTKKITRIRGIFAFWPSILQGKSVRSKKFWLLFIAAPYSTILQENTHTYARLIILKLILQGKSLGSWEFWLFVFFNTLILQFYKKSHIWCAWLFNKRGNSTQKITWIWGIFAFWPSFLQVKSVGSEQFWLLFKAAPNSTILQENTHT